MSNADIPNGWAKPDDLSKKIREVLNNKLISPEDEIADALEDMTRDIALLEPNPVGWGGWVKCFVEQMEADAQKRIKFGDFEKMLRALATDLQECAKGSR